MSVFSNSQNTVKNSIQQEFDFPKELDLLNKWTIPHVEPKVIYKFGMFEKLGFKQVVKTTEESIPLHNEEMTIKLLSEKDISPYKDAKYKFIHIGLVQIAFKPLTLEGLPESFIAALRDGRNLNWKQSLIGIIQSSLAHGPVYIDVYPNLQLSLSDPNIFEALTLNVKTHGYNYMPGTELICICYRIYYKPLFTLNPHCKRVDKPIGETILIETNFNKSNISTRRNIRWEEIEFPENWTIINALPPQPATTDKVLSVAQLTNGTVNLQFENNNLYMSRSMSSRHSYISPLDYTVRSSSRASTSQIREENTSNKGKIDELHIHNNIVKGVHNISDADITASEMNFSINGL